MKPRWWEKSKKYLSKKDSIMKNLINRFSDSSLTSRKDIFFSLCKSIIGQQISVAAANSVFLKFKKILGEARARECRVQAAVQPLNVDSSHRA